jgi:hypothetical protein
VTLSAGNKCASLYRLSTAYIYRHTQAKKRAIYSLLLVYYRLVGIKGSLDRTRF